MPTLADITVKNAAAANVTFTAISASAGDKSPARWRLETAGIPLGLRANLEIASQDNGPKTARRVVVSGNFPFTYTDTTTSQKVLLARMPFRTEFTLPSNLDPAQLADASVIATNVLASALVQAVLASGYAPT